MTVRKALTVPANAPAPPAGIGAVPAPAVPAAPAKPSGPEAAMRKMGLRRDIDLALHLPLRYEDETRITLLRDAREGDTVQIEATVTDSQVVLRPRRQLVVTVDDGR